MNDFIFAVVDKTLIGVLSVAAAIALVALADLLLNADKL